MRLYVGNLSYDVGEEELQQQFATYGEVTSVTIPRNGRSKGFGFVEMPQKAEAEAAIAGLNGKMLRDRPLNVSEARPRAEAGAGGARTGGFRREGGEGRGGGGGERRRRF